MLKARPGKEVILKLQNEVGALNQITKAIADRGIDLVAASTWVEGDQGIVHLVTSDNVRVLDILRGQGYHPREADVILIELPHKPGMLRRVTEKLAEAEIDIHHLYATNTAGEGTSLVVFATSNNDRAIVLLNP